LIKALSSDRRVFISRATDRYGLCKAPGRALGVHAGLSQIVMVGQLIPVVGKLTAVIGKLARNSQAQIVIGAKGCICSR
jgi:hypothetical protein